MKAQIKAKWLRIEEHTNALDYLEKVFHFLKEIDQNYYSWKWVMLSLHGAMYGFAFSACRGTNSDSVIRKTKRGSRLIDFNSALSLCQDLNWMRYAMSLKVLVLSHSQKQSIDKMKNFFRDEFVHFKPKGWSIEIHDFPIIALNCLDVIRFLVVDTYNPFRLGTTKVKKAKSLIHQNKKLIKNSLLYLETVKLKEMVDK